MLRASDMSNTIPDEKVCSLLHKHWFSSLLCAIEYIFLKLLNDFMFNNFGKSEDK